MRSILLLAVAAAAVRPVPAQPPDRRPSRAVRVQLENDLVAVRGRGAPPDFDYTHGSRVEVAWAGACADPRGREAGCTTRALALAQAIYTPRRDSVAPVPGERPYAGWLSLGAAARHLRRERVRTLAVELGVTGPPSLARPVQDGVHRLLDNRPQLGWSHQLATRLGALARWEESRPVARVAAGAREAALRARWEVAAGTVVTAASVGAILRVDAGRAAAWSPAAPEAPRPRRFHARLAWRQELVLHNVFVEGWGPDGGARLRPLVGQGEAGVGWRWRRGEVAYAHVARGREYRAQPRAHAWGRITVELR